MLGVARLVAVVALLCATARPAGMIGSPEYVRDLMAFHRAYDGFLRSMLGCPAHAHDTAECDPKLGTVDYAAYLKAAKLAGKVFPQ